MAEYIEREEAREVLCGFCPVQQLCDESDKCNAKEALNAIPAADVRPVVRCKDCRYAYDSVGGWCCSHGICVDCVAREDFFCADGERKDGDGE